MNKLKTFLLFVLSFLLLTGCSAKIGDLQQKSDNIRSKDGSAKEEVQEEFQPAVEDMSLDEIEEELEGMDDMEIEADLDEIDKELDVSNQ